MLFNAPAISKNIKHIPSVSWRFALLKQGDKVSQVFHFNMHVDSVKRFHLQHTPYMSIYKRRLKNTRC